MKPIDADHPPPSFVLAAVWRAGRPSPIIRPDLRADPGKRATRPIRGQLSCFTEVPTEVSSEAARLRMFVFTNSVSCPEPPPMCMLENGTMCPFGDFHAYFCVKLGHLPFNT